MSDAAPAAPVSRRTLLRGPGRLRTPPARPTVGTATRGRPGHRLAARLVAAVVTGAGMAVAFPPYGAWPLVVPCLAVVLLLLRGLRPGRAALVGLAHGLVFFLLLLGWLRVIGSDAWLGVATVEAAYLAPLGAGLALVARLRFWPLWAAGLWVAQEAVRARFPWGGFPWGRVAFAQTATPFTPYAALGGSALVTFATVLTAGLLAAGLLAGHRWLRSRPATGRPPGRALLRAAALVAAAALVPGIGLAVPVAVTDGAGGTDGAGDTAVVALVQGNVPRSGMDFLGQREQVLRNHVAATLDLAARIGAGAAPRPDLVIWPENSSDIDPFSDPAAYALIDSAVRAVGVPVLVGIIAADPDGVHDQNAGLVWDPRTGPGARYVKRHPVPFGEYIPLRAALTPWISRLQRIPRDMAAGDAPGVLDVGPVRVGDVMCFEMAYDGVPRDVVTGGAQVLVGQTNNATYGRTGQPEQQLAMSRLRAVEHGRAVLVAATSGISAVVAPDGRVVERTAEFEQRVLVARVPLRTARTPADRAGTTPEVLLVTLGVGAAVVALRGAGGRRPRRGADEPAHPARDLRTDQQTGAA